MRSWQDRGMPYFGNRYGALTHHRFWDGRSHYWPGMPVNGMDEQDPGKPQCCPDLELYEQGEIQPGRPALKTLRAGLRSRGRSHREAGQSLGLGLSSLRQRLYGRRPFSRAQFCQLCRIAGVDPAALAEAEPTEGA